MLLQFSCLRNAPSHEIKMGKGSHKPEARSQKDILHDSRCPAELHTAFPILASGFWLLASFILASGFWLLISGGLFAQTQMPAEKIKKDIDSIQNAVNEAVSAVPGVVVLQGTKGTYLEGYGVVVTMELALEPPRNPFSGFGRSSSEVKTAVNQRRKDTVEKLTNLLKQKTPTMESILPTESATIIVYLLNTNPADLPDLPSQLILSVKKQEAAAGRVSSREYK